MPSFSTLPMREALQLAQSASVPGPIARYVEHIESLEEGHAGRLAPSEGENLRTVRLRLSAAARHLRTKVIIRRVGNELLFWVDAPRR